MKWHAINADDLTIRFEAPWTLDDYAMFLRSKALPEVVVEYENDGNWPPVESYTLRAPARFAELVGLKAPKKRGKKLDLAPYLFDYQSWIVEMALAAKRFAIWSDCGTGKSPMQLEWARHVMARTGGRVLILAPLQVCHQTVEEADKFYPGDAGMKPLFLDSRKAMDAFCRGEGASPLGITNYHKFIDGVSNDVRRLAGVVLDESSMLRAGGGVLKWNVLKSTKGVEYKLSCTATPAPNDAMEYASQASFLEKLRNEGEILWTFFVRDQKTQLWTVKPHAREAFYRFMASWSIYLRKPGVYGFADPFAGVPEPEIVEIKVPSTAEQDREAHAFFRAYDKESLLPQERLGVKERSKLSQLAKGFIYEGPAAKRTTRRIESLKPGIVTGEILKAVQGGHQTLVWTVFDEESAILMEQIGGTLGVTALHGSMDEDERTAVLDRFRHGEIRCLISKAQLLGYGLNFQFCTRMIFSGFDDSFERFYQAVRRAYRYGSTERLKVIVPYVPSLENHVWENVLRKKTQWEGDIEKQERLFMEAHGRMAR